MPFFDIITFETESYKRWYDDVEADDEEHARGIVSCGDILYSREDHVEHVDTDFYSITQNPPAEQTFEESTRDVYSW